MTQTTPANPPANIRLNTNQAASPISIKPSKSTMNRFVDRVLERLSRVGLSDDTPCAVHYQEGKIFWGMENLPAREGSKNIFVCGNVGSGKTTIIRLFAQSIAPRICAGRERPEHLIITDSKCDILPTLAGLGLRPEDENMWILNPDDARCASWNLGEAAQMPLMARELACLLVPKEKNSTAPYFADGARQLTYAAMLGLNAVFGSNWSLRDLLCALDSIEHIRGIAANQPRAMRIVDGILNDERHAAGVISTLNVALGRYESVAALWHNNCQHKKFSVTEFLKKPGVLVLGNDPALKETLWPINAMLLKVLTQEILRGPNVEEPCHWFVLDEFPAMERVDCIPDLLRLGRSKGASVVLGFQNLASLTQVYDEHATTAMLSLCATKTFLRLGDPQTAEWAEKCVGTIRYLEESSSETYCQSGNSSTVSHSVVDRPQLLASVFQDLPFPEEGGPFSIVSDIPALNGIWFSTMAADDAFVMCKPDDKSVMAVDRRTDPAEQILQPWTPKEELFFCPTLFEAQTPRQDTAAQDQKPVEVKKPSEVTCTESSQPPVLRPRLPGIQPQPEEGGPIVHVFGL